MALAAALFCLEGYQFIFTDSIHVQCDSNYFYKSSDSFPVHRLCGDAESKEFIWPFFFPLHHHYVVITYWGFACDLSHEACAVASLSIVLGVLGNEHRSWRGIGSANSGNSSVAFRKSPERKRQALHQYWSEGLCAGELHWCWNDLCCWAINCCCVLHALMLCGFFFLPPQLFGCDPKQAELSSGVDVCVCITEARLL